MNVQKIISLARRHFTPAPGFDDAEALTYIQAVHNKILRLVRVKPDEDVDVSITAGTNAYTLDTLINRIWNARYVSSATASDSRPLYPRSVDELDFTTKGMWRDQPSGQPIWYDERAGQLILNPTPDTSTNAGYPKITLSVQKTDTLTLSSTLPVVDEYKAWIYGLCADYANEKAPDQFPRFEALYDKALNSLISFSEGKAARDIPSIKANIPKPHVT